MYTFYCFLSLHQEKRYFWCVKQTFGDKLVSWLFLQCSPESPMGAHLNDQCDEIRLPKIQQKWPHNIPKFMGHNESSVKGEGS